MSILYAIIAREIDLVLVEVSNIKGNCAQISRTLLRKVKKDSKLSYSYSLKYK